MRKRRFGDFPFDLSALVTPVTESRSKPVNRKTFLVHAIKQGFKNHDRLHSGLPISAGHTAGKYQIVVERHAKHAKADDAKKRIALLSKN